MKIAKIEAFLVRLQLVKPYLTADYKGQGLAEKAAVVLRLTTDAGLIGLGEADPFPTFTYESPETVMQMIRQYLGPALLGLDPRNIANLHAVMDATLPGWPFAKAPFDVAAYDLWGQSLGVPVWRLLGGMLRDRVPLIWPIGGDTPEANVAEVTAKMAEGYRSLHVKLGALTPDQDVARIRAIRQAIGPDVPIMVDINQGWDRSTALATICRLEPYNINLLEQPVPAWNMDGLAHIQATTSIPISADESLHSTHDAINLIKHNAVRVFSLKTGKCGGLFRTRQIAAIAEAAGMPCFVNSMIEMGISVTASLHLAAGLPNMVNFGHALMSNLRIKEDILADGSFQYNGKDILVPQNCSGLGIKLNEEKLARLTLDKFTLE